MFFTVVDYFDVWYNEDDGYSVNDLAVTDIEIEIDDTDNDEEIVHKLIEAGYLNDAFRTADYFIEWCDDTMCELFITYAGEGDCPVCRLEVRR